MSIVVSQPTNSNRKIAAGEKPRQLPGEAPSAYWQRLAEWRRMHAKQTKRSRKKPTRRCSSTAPMDWLKDKVFAHVYGEKVGDDVYPSMRKEAFVGTYNREKHGYSLPNYKYQDHFDGHATYYYFSTPNKTAEHALVMIDIDVLKRRMLGSPEGARKFAAFLRTWFPTLYVEPSTGGKGQHAYLLVYKPGYSAEEVKKALKHLETWLGQQAEGFDIELVEVKGTSPVIEYGRGGMIDAITYGTFAKLPRDVSRFDEWTGTTTLTIQDILALELEEEKVGADVSATSGPVPKVSYNKEKLNVGSVSGKNISDEELERMPTWERFFEKARKRNPLHGDRWEVTATDFAQAIVLLRFFMDNPNPDGSLPQRRVQELWMALHEAGDFSRPWNHHRWKAIRDWMSEMGWLHWQDHRYQIGTGRGNGQACKWSLHDEFVQLLEDFATRQEQGGASFVDTRVTAKLHGEPLQPLRCWLRQAEEAEFWLEAEKACENLCAA